MRIGVCALFFVRKCAHSVMRIGVYGCVRIGVYRGMRIRGIVHCFASISSSFIYRTRPIIAR